MHDPNDVRDRLMALPSFSICPCGAWPPIGAETSHVDCPRCMHWRWEELWHYTFFPKSSYERSDINARGFFSSVPPPPLAKTQRVVDTHPVSTALFWNVNFFSCGHNF
eukprot:EG_transcript_23479